MLGAFVLSAVLGIALAIAIVWNRLLLRTIMPVLVLFNTLPKIALAPLFILWLGYGVWPNIVIGTTIAFFPMVVNTAIGSRAPSPKSSMCARCAPRAGRCSRKSASNAAFSIFAGLKLNATMSVTAPSSASSSPPSSASARSSSLRA